MDAEEMSIRWATLAVSALFSSLPLLVVCVVGIVATFRAKSLPRSAMKLSAAGFICITVQIVVSIIGQYAFHVLRVKPESIKVLGLQLLSIGMLQTTLLVAGVAVLGLAVFVGRKQ
jgi:hypothetical protein